jgi:tRNA pseudouridine38-40 synthase
MSCSSPRCGPSVDHGRVGWVHAAGCLGDAAASSRHLIGEHDFSSFRAAACQALSPVKKLMRLDIARRGAFWRFEFEANAFLHHMVRNIMGCLMAIGQGKHAPDWMAQVLQARSRGGGAHLCAGRPVLPRAPLRTPLGPAGTHRPV